MAHTFLIRQVGASSRYMNSGNLSRGGCWPRLDEAKDMSEDESGSYLVPVGRGVDLRFT